MSDEIKVHKGKFEWMMDNGQIVYVEGILELIEVEQKSMQTYQPILPLQIAEFRFDDKGYVDITIRFKDAKLYLGEK